MSADDLSGQSPFSLLAMLAVRYPGWTIWYGEATRHWWALPPTGSTIRDLIDGHVEARDVRELVDAIEAILVRHHPAPAAPNAILLGEAEASRAVRVPAAAWPGGGPR